MTDVSTIQPLGRVDWESLALAEYCRFADQLRSLSAGDWARPTDCSLWDVRAIVGHSVGMMSDFTSYRAVARRMSAAARAARTAGGPLVDSLTAMQVADTAHLSGDELIRRMEQIGPQAARWRASVPAVIRRMPLRQAVGDRAEWWRLGYLLDTILTRDPWMHRVDIARATSRQLDLTADHDGRIVADVVAEWARRHGRPFTLELTGPAGGSFTAGRGTREQLIVDAVDFCRTVAGRSPGTGLLAQQVPF